MLKQQKKKISQKPRGFNYNSLTSNIGERRKIKSKKVYIVLKARLLKIKRKERVREWERSMGLRGLVKRRLSRLSFAWWQKLLLIIYNPQQKADNNEVKSA